MLRRALLGNRAAAWIAIFMALVSLLVILRVSFDPSSEQQQLNEEQQLQLNKERQQQQLKEEQEPKEEEAEQLTKGELQQQEQPKEEEAEQQTKGELQQQEQLKEEEAEQRTKGELQQQEQPKEEVAPKSSSQEKCPSYFAWIHEDLAPWSDSGITEELMEEARRRGDFRLVIVDGKLYFTRYHECIQTRDEITLGALFRLIENFPGTIPDMEMIFVCNDFPEIVKGEYQGKQPPPVFSYCTTRVGDHFDILFPDWSFWGWPQVRIRPWEEESAEIFQGASGSEWSEREPIAYWKGNLWVMTPVREALLQCNKTEYNVIVYYLDWGKEAAEGYQTSSLSKQCHTRYKIYAEGRGWSASLKYVMACGSTMLHIEPDYWEFFARSWLPYEQYWPISRENMCSSLKHAVEWGNAHPAEAAAIGKHGQDFLKEQLTMDHVYSYIVHLMQAYAKLQRFKPQAPEGVQPWTLNRTEAGESTASTKLCEMVPRDQESLAKIIAKQVEGYRAKQEL